MDKREKVNWKGVLSIILIFIVVFVIFPRFIYSNVSIVCASYKEEYEGARGAPFVRYKFKIGNEIRLGSFEKGMISRKELDLFKKGQCLEVEVSNYWYFFNRLKA